VEGDTPRYRITVAATAAAPTTTPASVLVTGLMVVLLEVESALGIAGVVGVLWFPAGPYHESIQFNVDSHGLLGQWG
jgi:hypothetical protein